MVFPIESKTLHYKYIIRFRNSAMVGVIYLLKFWVEQGMGAIFSCDDL